MRSPDVLIIGGGLAGMFSALELAKAGLSVHVVERGNLGRESSWAGAGILSPLHPWRYSPAILELARVSQQRYPVISEELFSQTGIDPEFQRCGMLFLEPEAWPDAQLWAAKSGMQCEQLQPATLRALEPACGPDTEAIHLPDVAQIRNPRLLQALECVLRSMGVTLFSGTKVLGFERSGADVTKVHTSDATWQPGRVVIAAGAWSGELTAGLSSPLNVWPAKGEMLLFKGSPGGLRHILLKGECYLVPRKDGRILAGSTVEESGFDASATSAARAKLMTSAAQLMPSLSGYEIEGHWAGLRPASKEGVPIIGAHPELRNLYANTGHFRHGVLTAPASAELLADLILDRRPRVNPALYQWLAEKSARVV